MGIVLYRPGEKYTIDGIKCDLKVFDENLYASYLKRGWFSSPDQCYPTKKEPKKRVNKSKRKKKDVDSWQPEI